MAGGGGGSFKSKETMYNVYHPGDKDTPPHYIDQVIVWSNPGAGGGNEGASAPLLNLNHIEGVDCILKGGTQTTGYKFGQGQSGYAGAGGGWYGGTAENQVYLSGAGGSGYIKETNYDNGTMIGTNQGNGKAKITYQGNIEREITVKLNGSGSYNGVTSQFKLKYNVGDTVELPSIQMNSGYTFNYFRDALTKEKINNVFIMQDKDMEIEVYFNAPLVIEKEKESEQSIKIKITQQDSRSKYFKILQSKDGIKYYDAFLSMVEDGGEVRKNMVFEPGYYEYKVPYTGDYKFRLYGAQGGSAYTAQGGRGGYTEGIITLQKGEKIYITVGNTGDNNGGGKSTGNVEVRPGLWQIAYGAGGSSTDIRVNENKVENRIMVAAGGGGGAFYGDGSGRGGPANGGYGGGLSGGSGGKIIFNTDFGDPPPSAGGTQTTGHALGKGAGNSGGSGYWGGHHDGLTNQVFSGGGGSSYISGFSGCKTFPGYVFTNNVMTANTRTGEGIAYLDLMSDTAVYGTVAEDIYFEDTKAPNIPSNGKTQVSEDSCIITWNNNGDNGNKYWHKVESYNADTNELIGTSNILEDYIESGVKGWYYYLDNNPTGTVTKDNIFTLENKVSIPSGMYSYIHIACVDNAGNISDTYNYELIVYYIITYDKNDTKININGNNTSEIANGIVLDTKAITTEPMIINYNKYTKIGYTFDHWNTKSDGTGIKYEENQIVTYKQLGKLNTTLYAIWRPNRYNIIINGNGSWDNKEDILIETEYDKPTQLPINTFTRNDKDKTINDYIIDKGYDFIGYSDNKNETPQSGEKIYKENEDITNILTGDKATEIYLYALWKKDIQLEFDLNGGYGKAQKLEYTLYNSELYHDFNIEDYYGTFNSNGINDKFTKISSNGTQSRFVGWSDKIDKQPLVNSTLQIDKVNLLIYDTNRSKTIRLYDSQKLYASWENCLYVTAEIGRTLGNIPYADSNIEHRLKLAEITADIEGKYLRTIIRPGEQGFYSLRIYNGNELNTTAIKFSSLITDIYDNGDANSIWKDTLNPISNNPLDIEQKHGLDKLYIGNNEYINNKWFTPLYYGTDNSYETSIGKDNYNFFVQISQPSIYWNTIHNKDETVVIQCIIDTTDKDIIDNGGHAPNGGNTVLDELRTRLKIRLKNN